MSEDRTTIRVGDALRLGDRLEVTWREIKPAVADWVFSAIAILFAVGLTVLGATISIENKAIERATHAGDPR